MIDHFEITEILESKKWTFAKTMPAMPHYWSSRDQWGDNKQFEYVVQYLRDHGPKEIWGKYKHNYFYSSGFKYWTMGAPLNITTIINRAIPSSEADYDSIAHKYDGLFCDRESLAETKEAFKMTNAIGRILDIGCGTGTAVEWLKTNPFNYVGIDPSGKMLQRFIHKHPQFAASLQKCSFENYWGTGFDTIIAMFGTASYVENIEKIKKMLNPNGTAFLMFYQDDYTPITYKKTGVNFKRKTDSKNPMIKFGQFNIEKITNENLS